MRRHDEAIAEVKKAIELDPLFLPFHSFLGRTYHLARRYDDALAQLKRSGEMNPASPRPEDAAQETRPGRAAFTPCERSDYGIDFLYGGRIATPCIVHEPIEAAVMLVDSAHSFPHNSSAVETIVARLAGSVDS